MDRLKPILYGLAYTPFNALEPWCGATLNNVTEDILLMSQLTSALSFLHRTGRAPFFPDWTGSPFPALQPACACTARPAIRLSWSFRPSRTPRYAFRRAAARAATGPSLTRVRSLLARST